MNKIKYIAAALIAVAGLGLQHAKADTFSYTLTTGNDPSLGAGPFGTVLVNRTNSSTATITFTAAAGYLFVDGGAVAVNVNAASWTVSSFTVNAGANPVTNSGSRSEDGFGIFNQTGSQANSSNGASSVSFTLTAAAGTWASAANVLINNALGNAVAAHIQIASGPSQGVTGFVTGPGTPSVPDGGATVMLLGMAFGALGMVRRYLVS
jgi:VPDSG-CTERM exosortase interaction domain